MSDPATTGATPRRTVGITTFLPYLRDQVPAIAAVAVLSVVAAGGTLAQPLLIQSVLDRVGTTEPLWGLVLLLVTALAGVAVLNAVRGFLLRRTAEAMVLSIRRRLAGHLLRLPVAEYDQRRTGDLLSRVGADSNQLRMVVTSGLLEVGTAGVIIVGAATMMLLIDPAMFALAVVAMGGLAGAILVARKLRSASAEVQARVGEMTAAVERAISAVRTIRAARAEERETATVIDSATRAYHAGVRMARLHAVISPLDIAAVQIGLMAVLGFGGARVAAGQMSLGDLVAFVLFLFLMMVPIGQLVSAYTRLQSGLGAMQRIQDVLDLPTEATTDPPAGPLPTAVPGPTAVPAVEFDRVSFAYPTGEQVLHEVSFTVPAGSRTALVGPSGAGKSTVLALVERFYDPTSGVVRVNGVDVRAQPRSHLRAHLGYVEQEAPVLAGTIRDNLLLTTPDADEATLREVLAAVRLDSLVNRTAAGLDAQVGEGGVLLSGGERQRLAIARALLAGAPILLLDEPTSNLDARSEHALRQVVDAVSQQCTVIVVAHRLATVADADQIVVLDRGRVNACGTHAELTAADPLYREFAAHQLLVS